MPTCLADQKMLDNSRLKLAMTAGSGPLDRKKHAGHTGHEDRQPRVEGIDH